MDDKYYQQLVQDFPDLFEKSDDISLEVGNGWYNIIHTLCGLICYDISQARLLLKYALEHPDRPSKKSLAELESAVAQAILDLPKINQVKEKFGSLRFYLDRDTEKIYNYITFAESLSRVTCEECGAPGVSRNDGWVKVWCDKHYHSNRPSSACLPPTQSQTWNLLDEE